MRVNPMAWLVFATVMALFWLAVEGNVALAGIALDGMLGWGLLGVSAWVILFRVPGYLRRLHATRGAPRS